jgi:hypothetical protein
MSNNISSTRQIELTNRADRLLAAISTLEQKIEAIKATGPVAPRGTHLARYQARGSSQAYWYYKLHAEEPVFPKSENPEQLSRYQHLGAAGTPAHIDGLMMVLRRAQIDELQKAIDNLRDCWADLYPQQQQ